jgi:hypothetical protein
MPLRQWRAIPEQKTLRSCRRKTSLTLADYYYNTFDGERTGLSSLYVSGVSGQASTAPIPSAPSDALTYDI